jgi:hypothetical protein
MGNVTWEAAIDALSATEDARNQLNAIPRSDRGLVCKLCRLPHERGHHTA